MTVPDRIVPVVCPSCSASAIPGAVACAKCGTLLTNEAQGAEGAALLESLSRALEGRYVVGDVLGSGRGGLTVRARNVASKRDVAIKVAWDDPDARTRVLRETVLTAKVGHPSSLAVRDIPAPEPMLVVEMPLLLGGTLSDLLEARGPIPFAQVHEIIRSIAGALDQAHAAGIIHGGIRPVKILLDEAGNAFLSDFAIRIPRRADWDVSRPSSVGAQAYMPLEQRHDSESIDGRADQYALAIIAYELLRGQTTWRINDEGVMEVDAIDIMVHRPIAPGAPLSASMAIKRAIAKDPVFRYASAGAFVRAFSGEVVDVVAKEHIHRDEVNVKQRRSVAWIVVPLVLGALALAAQRDVREEAVRQWNHFSFGTGGIQKVTDREGTSSAPTVQGAATPPSPSSAQSPRAEPSGAPTNTRVGSEAATPRTVAGGPPLDIYPKATPAATPAGNAASATAPANTNRPAGSAPSPVPGSQGSARSSGRRSTVAGEITGESSKSATEPSEGVVVVTLNADARAVVMVDGRPRGRTPLSLRLKSGSHTVSLSGGESYSPTSKSIVIGRGDTTSVTFTVSGRP